MNPEIAQQASAAFTQGLGRILFGAEEQARLAWIALLVRGHVLLESVPGTGKTLFVRTIARPLGIEMHRLQCTPDLMPGDVLGANIFDFRTQSFALTKGPIFTEFLLVDEINRTPPKTQSALLEAMQERSVTIDGTTHTLSHRFVVLATQNPIEQEGTYPLPEAQLDRFLFQLRFGYPTFDDEVRIILAHGTRAAMPDLDALGIQPVLTPENLDTLCALVQTIHLDPQIAQYIARLAQATRSHPSLAVGISPRAASMLAAASRAQALTSGRTFTTPDDVKRVFSPLARHRVVLSPLAEMERASLDAIMEEVLTGVAPPR